MQDASLDAVRQLIDAIPISPELCVPHPLLVKRPDWIQANVNVLEKLGSPEWLDLVLTVLGGEMLTREPVTARDVAWMTVNPFYAITVSPERGAARPSIGDRAAWIDEGAALIQEQGARVWLDHVLTSLGGPGGR